MEAEAKRGFSRREMTIVRYIVGVIGFLLVWFVVAVVFGAIMAMIFPRPDERVVFVGIGLDWRNIPGTILGALAGIQSFRASVNERKKQSVKAAPEKNDRLCPRKR